MDGFAANEGLVLSVEASHSCRPFSCLHAMITAMCVASQSSSPHSPHSISLLASDHCWHVCVHNIHTPRQDGNRLYQPAHRNRCGKINIQLVKEIMEVLAADTCLFTALPGGKKWLFDPYGAAPGEDGKVDKGVVHIVAICHILSP